MKTSDKGIRFIKRHEGLRLTVYRCTSGVLTIGYGHTRGVKPGQVITEKEAELFLREDLTEAETAVNNFVNAKPEQHRFDALVSFVFNVGSGAFKKSTLLFLINQGAKSEAIEQQFMKWINSAGKPSAGLKSRRAKEVKLYLKGEYE